MEAGNLVQHADSWIKGLSLTNFDIIIFTIIGLSTLVALFRGFIKSFLSLVGWIISLVLALQFYESLSHIFEKYTASESLADLAGFSAVFLISAIVIAIINGIIITLLKEQCGGVLDRSFGLFFGLIRGCVVVSAMFYVMLLMIPELVVKDRDEVMNKDKLPKWAKNSQSLLLLSKGAGFIEAILPRNFQDNIKKSLTEQKTVYDKQDEYESSDYILSKKPKISLDTSSNIRAMNEMLAALPKAVVNETPQEDLFVLQDSAADPAIKVQILEKIASNYQKYTNEITDGASADKIQRQHEIYHKIYPLIEEEITRYNAMINAIPE